MRGTKRYLWSADEKRALQLIQKAWADYIFIYKLVGGGLYAVMKILRER